MIAAETDRDRPLRHVLGRYPTGVAVITACHRGRTAGVTVNSFTSLPLRPPLVLWCLSRASSSRAVFAAADHFAVNILSARQQAIAVAFAQPGDRFARARFRAGRYRLPQLEGAVGTLLCRRDQTIPAGDHLAFIGEVVQHDATDGAPLLFLDGHYHAGPLALGEEERPTTSIGITRGGLPSDRAEAKD